MRIVGVNEGWLVDIDEGRSAAPIAGWLRNRLARWWPALRFATLDMSGPYRKVFDDEMPDAIQIADPFHLVTLANQMLDDVRRRVQQDLPDRRGHKHEPLFEAQTLLVLAH